MAFQNATYSNSGSAYFGNPADWSNYSTITSTIRFNNTNATLRVRPASPDSNTTVEFNGNQLAYLSDIPDPADWAQYPANNDVSIPPPYSLIADSASISSLTVFTQTTQNLVDVSTFTASTLTVATANISTTNTKFITSSTISIIADGLNNTSFPSLDVVSKNGTGGRITLQADPGVSSINGGLIRLISNGGAGNLGTYGEMDLISNFGSSPIAGVSAGGLINITATSGPNDVTLTSAIKLSAAGINIQSGLTVPIVGLAGYTFIGGNTGVNSCAGIPAVFPNIPGTNYMYGTNGIVLNSEVYTTDILPYWDGNTFTLDDLTVAGRPAVPGLHGPAFLNLELVSTMSGKEINIGCESTLTMTAPIITLDGVSTINGSPYQSGFVSTATSDLNMSDFRILSTSTVEFSKIPTLGVTDRIGIQPALDIQSTNTVFQAYDTDSVTNPPVIKPMRTSYLYLTNGTPTSAPVDYGQDLQLNGAGNNRITATQYNGAVPTPSTFTVAYLSDPLNQLDIYCSPDGVDTVIAGRGSGQLLNPFRTINFALLQTASIPDTSIVVIHLAAGTYTETVLVTRNNTFIVGNQIKHDINIGIDILGSVTFNITGATATVISGGISFCNMYQLNVIQTQALTGTYTVANCNMNPNTTIPCFSQTGAASAVVHTTNFTNCDFNQITAANCATMSIGACVFQNCDFRSSSASSMINVTANGRLILQYCNVSSTYSGTAFNPLVNIANTNTVTGGQINFCNLLYFNKAIDAGLNKCAVRFANGAAVTYQITYSNLLCEGAQRTNGGSQFQCIQQTAGGTTNLFYGFLQGEATAHHISNSASMIKTSYIPVP
jgi:hypothetical protein